MSLGLSLSLCNGPSCTRCGCQDVEVLREPADGATTWWAAGQARCRHCGCTFYFRDRPAQPIQSEPAVEPARVIPQVDCPTCGAAMKVASTTKTLRKYKCQACGATAKRPRNDS